MVFGFSGMDEREREWGRRQNMRVIIIEGRPHTLSGWRSKGAPSFPLATGNSGGFRFPSISSSKVCGLITDADSNLRRGVKLPRCSADFPGN